LAALLITDDSIRAEPVPDIARSLELLDVPGSALEAPALAELTVALAAMRVVAADLNRLHDARRTTHEFPPSRSAGQGARSKTQSFDLQLVRCSTRVERPRPRASARA
jgi:hypothetical protein